jgi:hypothetical protein
METKQLLLVAALAALALTATACGGASQPAAPTHSGAAAATPITCAGIDPALDKAVSDLKSMDTHYQEAWVSGGDSADLQTLINVTRDAASGGNQLNSDAATFNSDATTYLSDNTPDLAPGWQSGYSTVTADIDALATDCGQPTAPANNPGNS